MDDDTDILAVEIDFDASADFEDFDDDIDNDELAYWDEFQRRERQEAYDDEWGDPLYVPSCGS